LEFDLPLQLLDERYLRGAETSGDCCLRISQYPRTGERSSEVMADSDKNWDFILSNSFNCSIFSRFLWWSWAFSIAQRGLLSEGLQKIDFRSERPALTDGDRVDHAERLAIHGEPARTKRFNRLALGE